MSSTGSYDPHAIAAAAAREHVRTRRHARRPGIQDMLKEVCRKKGLTYDDFVADLKKKGQWRVEVY